MIILGTNSVKAAGGFDVANSLRFNDGSSDNLSRTTETPTNADKYTFSVWVKRSNLGAANMKIFGVQGANANEQNLLEFNADDLVWMQTDSSGGNTVYRLRTDRVFRDPSAWYHIVVAYDSSQGTANNRIRMYINGVEETSFSTRTNPSANLNSLINSSVSATAGRTLRLGRTGDNGSQYFDGYMSEVCFIDGLQLDPTSFGEFDEDSGIWKPIDGLADDLTFNNNGFYLEFKESGTGTNASGMGADTSGNTNHFAVNNLTAIDQSTDTCTNNFATMNPLRQPTANPATFSNGNLTVQTNTSSGYYGGRSTIVVSSGKWYFEAKLVSYSASTGMIGIQNVESYTPEMFSSGQGIFAGYSSTGLSYDTTGVIGVNNNFTSYGDTYAAGDIISVALNLEDNEVKFYKNGTVQNSGTAISITAGLTYVFAVDDGSSSRYCTWDCNFGSPSFAISSGNTDGNGFGNFEYAVPSGYYALNTKNLAEYG